MTSREWVHAAESRLAAVGIEAPRLEAQLLAAYALEIDRSRLLPRLDDPMHAAESADRLLARRLAGEPLAYIRGVREFYGRSFRVGPGVLVPRHETETLVEALLRLAPPGARVLDVGTGSGCIALTASAERPDLRVAGIDRSPDALRWARANRQDLGLSVELVLGDLVSPFRDHAFDVLATNPPYIAQRDPLPNEIARWEPPEALWAGEDGLACYARLAREAPRVLVPGGVVLAEVGHTQSVPVVELFETAGCQLLETLPDLAGIPRVVALRVP